MASCHFVPSCPSSPHTSPLSPLLSLLVVRSAGPVGVAVNTAFMTPYSALDVVVPLCIDWMTLFPSLHVVVPPSSPRSTAPVGVAANTAFMTPYSALDVVVPLYIDWMTLFPWVDHIQHHLDFCGLNYYGQEFMSTAGLQSVEEEEFSEAGRAVYPDGFYRILMAFHRRYSPSHPALRFIVTENGFADTEDNIRRPYLIEHLLALNAAIKEGMPIDGYFHWTISDNWEWADGYCPKFGLAGVDRTSANLTRVLRPSYGLFKEIVESRQVTAQQREEEWGQLQQRAERGEQRSYCRAVEPSGRMGADSLDSPSTRVIATKDWRYGEYRRPKAAVMVKRTARIFRIWLEDLLLAAQQAADAANSLLCRLMHGPHHQHEHQHQHQQQQQQQQVVEQQQVWEEVEADTEIPPVAVAAAAAGAASADKDEL
ncbi:unnamed protein product [Closterium sp. NIES-53]